MIGIFPGTFDFLHPGHLKAIREAHDQCDCLVIALQVDASIRPDKNPPVFTPSERYWMLGACRWVDEIVPYSTEDELVSMLKFYAPCVRFLGEDWKDKDYTGRDVEGIKTVFLSRQHDWSSSNIRARLNPDTAKDVVMLQ